MWRCWRKNYTRISLFQGYHMHKWVWTTVKCVVPKSKKQFVGNCNGLLYAGFAHGAWFCPLPLLCGTVNTRTRMPAWIKASPLTLQGKPCHTQGTLIVGQPLQTLLVLGFNLAQLDLNLWQHPNNKWDKIRVSESINQCVMCSIHKRIWNRSYLMHYEKYKQIIIQNRCLKDVFTSLKAPPAFWSTLWSMSSDDKVISLITQAFFTLATTFAFW